MGFPLPQCLRGAAEPLSFGLFLSGRLFTIASHRLRPDRKCSSTSPGTQEMWSLSKTSRWKKEDQITWCTNKQSGPFFSFLGLWAICLFLKETSCIFSNYYELSYIRFNQCLWTIIDAMNQGPDDHSVLVIFHKLMCTNTQAHFYPFNKSQLSSSVHSIMLKHTIRKNVQKFFFRSTTAFLLGSTLKGTTMYIIYP